MFKPQYTHTAVLECEEAPQDVQDVDEWSETVEPRVGVSQCVTPPKPTISLNLPQKAVRQKNLKPAEATREGFVTEITKFKVEIV